MEAVTDIEAHGARLWDCDRIPRARRLRYSGDRLRTWHLPISICRFRPFSLARFQHLHNPCAFSAIKQTPRLHAGLDYFGVGKKTFITTAAKASPTKLIPESAGAPDENSQTQAPAAPTSRAPRRSTAHNPAH
jgi:hypothetical protein